MNLSLGSACVVCLSALQACHTCTVTTTVPTPVAQCHTLKPPLALAFVGVVTLRIVHQDGAQQPQGRGTNQ